MRSMRLVVFLRAPRRIELRVITMRSNSLGRRVCTASESHRSRDSAAFCNSIQSSRTMRAYHCVPKWNGNRLDNLRSFLGHFVPLRSGSSLSASTSSPRLQCTLYSVLSNDSRQVLPHTKHFRSVCSQSLGLLLYQIGTISLFGRALDEIDSRTRLFAIHETQWIVFTGFGCIVIFECTHCSRMCYIVSNCVPWWRGELNGLSLVLRNRALSSTPNLDFDSKSSSFRAITSPESRRKGITSDHFGRADLLMKVAA